jgi:7-dehydrocholesterol reductase
MTAGCAALLVGSPLFVTYLWMSCQAYQCALSGPLVDVLVTRNRTLTDLIVTTFPRPTVAGFAIFASWYALQALLALLLPGRVGYGSVTPAGNRLVYRLNGLSAWVVTHVLLVLAVFAWKLAPATLLPDHWGALLVAANTWGFAAALFAYGKAYRFWSRPEDRHFSGSRICDFFAGVELNPRIGALDLKLFHIGRVGMLAWSVINVSFAAKQYATLGYVTNSMVILNVLQLIYVVDLFVREDWYLRTIDIQHDRFGFYFAWGATVWLPFFYPVQSFYLVQNPVSLSPGAAAGVLALGLAGYGIFVSANRQRDRFRQAEGPCRIWGDDARFIEASYRTLDGETRRTRLLTSGWWGLVRHANYVGDIMMAAAFGLACGFGHFLPYLYVTYLTGLLVHRTYRDERRCSEKYGQAWGRYRATVKYRMLPWVW